MCFACFNESRERKLWKTGGGGGVAVTWSHTQLHRTVSTDLNSWEKSRSLSSCCCVLLRKPHMEPHVTASDQQQNTLEPREHRRSHIRADSQTQLEAQWEQEHTLHAHSHNFCLLVSSNCEHIMKQPWQRHKEIYVSAQWYISLSPFRVNIWVHIASHSPFCKFVRKVITALWLMLTRGSLLKGECQTQSHSCLAAAACVAHMQRQIRSLLWKTVVVQPTLHSAHSAAAWRAFEMYCKCDNTQRRVGKSSSVTRQIKKSLC